MVDRNSKGSAANRNRILMAEVILTLTREQARTLLGGLLFASHSRAAGKDGRAVIDALSKVIFDQLAKQDIGQ